MEPIIRLAVMGPGSKTFINTSNINSEKVQTERQSSTIKTNGVVLKTPIQEKIINNMGTIEINKDCLLEVDKEKIPAKRNSIQKIFNTTIKNE
jgi:hypothetical protein